MQAFLWWMRCQATVVSNSPAIMTSIWLRCSVTVPSWTMRLADRSSGSTSTGADETVRTQFESSEQSAHVRVAEHNNHMYLYLGDDCWRAAEVARVETARTSASVYAFQGAPFVFFFAVQLSLKCELCKRARHSPLFLFRLWTGSPIDTKLLRRVRFARMRFHKLRHDHNARNWLLDHIYDRRFGLQRTWWGSSSGSPRSRLLRD
jgi:hypothetical protein